MIARLSGQTVEWLRHNTSWGHGAGESWASKSAWDAIAGAPRRRVGYGYQVRVELLDDEAESLIGILDSIAGAGESMTGAERGDAASEYRAIRRDCERLVAQR